MSDPALVVSFSGGRTSAMMAYLLSRSPRYARARKVYVYANTGKERVETLDFIEECDRRWGLGVVWVEAVVSPEKGVGTSFRITDRAGAFVNTDPMTADHPFSQVVSKYGVFNNNYPHCTRELKARPIKAYLRSLGLEKGSYVQAWGIRADEPRRLVERPGVFYPLAEMGVTEREIWEFWESQDFDLGLSQYEGNCDLCFKKSLRKRLTILRDYPEFAGDWLKLEGLGGRDGKAMRFDRDGLSVGNLLEMSESESLERAVDQKDELLAEPWLFEVAKGINWDFETECHCQRS